MSPALAWHDSIFRSYLAILGATLLGAGIILTIVQFVRPKSLGEIWHTYFSWLIMGPLVALAIFSGRVAFVVATAVVAAFAFREFARASGLVRDRAITPLVYFGVGVVAVGSLFVRSPNEYALPVIALILLFPVLRNRTENGLRSLSLGMIGFVLLGWMFGYVGFLANSAHRYGYLCYLIFATELNDVVAFVCGKIFGRHPLRDRISPRKSWEGALGALAISLILPWLLRFSFPFFGTMEHILTGLIVSLGGTFGDLTISLCKREFGAKDMGAAIPGHGGILDRIDSLIFTAPLFMQLTKHYHPW